MGMRGPSKKKKCGARVHRRGTKPSAKVIPGQKLMGQKCPHGEMWELCRHDACRGKAQELQRTRATLQLT